MNLRMAGATMLALQLATLPVAQALDIDAGDYDGLPTGITLALLYAQYAERDQLRANDARVPGDNGLRSEVSVLRLGHTIEIGGMPFVPQVLIPFARIEGLDDMAPLGRSSGVGDAIFAFPTWFYRDFQNHRHFGFTPFLIAPTGKYDQDRPLNVGENRWKLDLQLGFTTRIGSSPLIWDIAADTMFYTDNDKAGSDKLEQDTGWQLQTSMRYTLKPGIDLRGGVLHTDAGDTTLDGVEAPAYTQTRAWFGSGVFFSPSVQLIAVYSRDLDVDNGFKEAHRVNLRFLKIL